MTDVMKAPRVTAQLSPPGGAVIDMLQRFAGPNPHRARCRSTVTGAVINLVAAVGIPLMARSFIDGPVRHLDHRGLWVVGAAVTAFAVSEVVMFCVRRRLAAYATMTTGAVQIGVVTVCLLVMYWPLGLVVLGTILLRYCGERRLSMAAPWRSVLEVIPNLAGVVLLGHGAYAVRHGLVTMGTLVAFLLLTLSLVGRSTIASGRRSSAE